jgi:ribose transport system substrate-binding protein
MTWCDSGPVRPIGPGAVLAQEGVTVLPDTSPSASSGLGRPRRLAGILSALVLLAGCGSGIGQAAQAQDASGVDLVAAQKIADQYKLPLTAITQTKKLSKPAPKGKKIIFASSGLPATQLIEGGSQEAAEALGWTFESVTYDNANPATLQAALRTALAKKPDAVIIAGNAPATYGQDTLNAYKAAGVPLIVGSVCPLQATAPLVAGMLGCEVEEAAGKMFANWFIADSKGKGKALFVNVKAIPSLAAFVNAFKGEVGAKCASCSVDVLEATLAQIGENQVVSSAVNKIRSNPTYNYLFFDNAQWSKGALPALKAAGLGDKVKLGGRSLDEGALGLLQQGNDAAWTAVAYNVAGYGNIDAAVRYLIGETDVHPVVPPVQLVTKDNAKDLHAPFRYPANALDSYKALWGVS